MTQTNKSTLMKPVFFNGMFNRQGKRIRAIHLKTVKYDDKDYPLWVSAGKSEKDYPRAENDTHYLMLQVGEYLVPCGYTEYELISRVGAARLNIEWYGDFNGRSEYFDRLRNDNTFEDSEKLIKARIEEEEVFIKKYGQDEISQVKYILETIIQPAISQHIESRDNDGKRYNFVGAVILDEIQICEKIAKKIKEEQEKIELEKISEREAKEQAIIEAKNTEKQNQRAEFYGWADNMPELKFGKVYETLKATRFRYDGVVMNRMDFIITKIKDGFTPKQRDGVTRWYGGKWDKKESKPKTEYRLYDKENSFYTITKTEYDFAKYLFDNKILAA